MIDIYDEVGYIKNILQDGISVRWRRDTNLLAHYYKSLGLKPSEAKIKLKEKCEKRKDYNKHKDFSIVNSIVDKAYKSNVELREIRSVEFSKEVFDWFLNLENVEIDDKQVEFLKNKRKKIKITNKPMNFNRVKFLFTLFIWTKVQENYLDKPDRHYINKFIKRFKQDADLKQGFRINEEKNLLDDLKYIEIQNSLGIDAVFMKDPVFSIPVTDENKIVLSGEDLYNCGYWLTKQKMGCFVCENCGKEVAYKTKNKLGRPRKYCEDCYKKLYVSDCKKETAGGTVLKKVDCENCGKEFLVNLKSKTKLCSDCKEKLIKERDRERKSKKSKIENEAE